MIIQRINLISMCAQMCARTFLCFVAPVIGAGLLAGAGSVLGSLFSGLFGSSSSKRNAEIAASSQRETNATNIQMQRETNETNKQIAQDVNQTNRELAFQQNQWNIDQWNRENEYNSPENQVALYRSAGLNPAMVGGNFIPANSVQSAPLANQQIYSEQAPQIQDPEKNALGARQQGVMAELEMFRNAMNSLKDITKDYQELKESQSRIAKNESETKRSNADIELINQNLQNFRQEFDFKKKYNPLYIEHIQGQIDVLNQEFMYNKERLSKIYNENENLRLLRTIYEDQNKLMQIEIYNAQKLSDARLRLLGAQAYNETMQGFYNRGLGVREDKFNFFRVTHQGFDPHDITSQMGSQISADASRYSADKNFEGVKYSANTRFKETEYRVANDYGKMLAKGLATGIGFGVSVYTLGRFKSPSAFGKSFLRFVRTSEKTTKPINNLSWFFKP